MQAQGQVIDYLIALSSVTVTSGCQSGFGEVGSNFGGFRTELDRLSLKVFDVKCHFRYHCSLVTLFIARINVCGNGKIDIGLLLKNCITFSFPKGPMILKFSDDLGRVVSFTTNASFI